MSKDFSRNIICKNAINLYGGDTGRATRARLAGYKSDYMGYDIRDDIKRLGRDREIKYPPEFKVLFPEKLNT